MCVSFLLVESSSQPLFHEWLLADSPSQDAANVTRNRVQHCRSLFWSRAPFTDAIELQFGSIGTED
jgi:hypothetical protein